MIDLYFEPRTKHKLSFVNHNDVDGDKMIILIILVDNSLINWVKIILWVANVILRHIDWNGLFLFHCFLIDHFLNLDALPNYITYRQLIYQYCVKDDTQHKYQGWLWISDEWSLCAHDQYASNKCSIVIQTYFKLNLHRDIRTAWINLSLPLSLSLSLSLSFSLSLSLSLSVSFGSTV